MKPEETKISNRITELAVGSINAQGHKNRGNLERSAKTMKSGKDEFTLSLNGSAGVLDTGIQKNRIPFSSGSGAKSSMLVDGLVSYGQDKGVDNPLSFAFAVIKSWIKEGFPTNKSKRFSKNGKRKDWTGDFESDLPQLKKVFDEIF